MLSTGFSVLHNSAVLLGPLLGLWGEMLLRITRRENKQEDALWINRITFPVEKRCLFARGVKFFKKDQTSKKKENN